MKSNKALIIVIVVIVNILAAYTLGQSLLGKTSKYDQQLAEARAYAESELCSKAIEKYEEAGLTQNNTADVTLEMIEVYKKGVEIGEFTSMYTIIENMKLLINKFNTDNRMYESVCQFLIDNEKYEECAELFKQAQDLKVSSEKLAEQLESVRYKYKKGYTSYTDVYPAFDGMQLAVKENGYVYLNEEAGTELNNIYTYGSPMNGGYAFVKSVQADGKERAYIINAEEARQAYLDEVEESSGIGVALDAEGNQLLLLAGKVGDVYKYYDVKGNQVLDEYEFAGRFRNDVAAVKVGENQWKLINGTGKEITDKVFTDVILNEFDECAPKGYIIAKDGEKYHIYDTKAEKIGNFSCDNAKAFVDSYAAFEQDGKWGFVDWEGNVVIEAQYEDAKSFSNGIGAIKNSTGWMFINADNEIVIQEVYEDISYLNSKGICFVKIDGTWSYIEMYYTAG